MLFRLKTQTLLLLSCSLFFTQINHAEEAPPQAMASAECLQDIDFTAKFLLENDAGIRAKNWTAYPENIQKILDEQKLKANSVTNVKECKEIAKPFIKKIRSGHLWLTDSSKIEHAKSTGSLVEPEFVTTNKISNLTTYINIPSFDFPVKDQLEKIIKTNQSELLTAQYLIIDLRKSNGGNDGSAMPLYTILGEAEYWSETPQMYATPATIDAWKNLVQMIPNLDSRKEINQLIKKMEQKQTGWVPQEDQKEVFFKITKLEMQASPQKAIVLTDKSCGSSCEEFVKKIRQNSKVITMGRNTYGALDASNMVEVKAPSGKLFLGYPTSYIHRRTGHEIDNIGIPPSIKLPKPNNEQEYENEVKFAQDYLEKEKWK